jgi:DNA-directed RNA polymerase subunit M/transcription elongation factor TFIIS
MKEWFCPNCKRILTAADTDASRISIVGVTGQMSCKFCGYAPIVEFKKIEGRELEEASRKFHRENRF